MLNLVPHWVSATRLPKPQGRRRSQRTETIDGGKIAGSWGRKNVKSQLTLVETRDKTREPNAERGNGDHTAETKAGRAAVTLTF
jgi:hypothetical protein